MGTPEVKQRARERERNVLALRLQGATFEQIGTQLRISTQGAEKSYKRALRRIPEKEAILARKEALTRLDSLRVLAWTRLKGMDRSDPNYDAAVQSVLRIEQREAKLLGLDAPRQLEVQTYQDPDALAENQKLQTMLAKLSIEEKRDLLNLMIKASNEGDSE